MDDRNMGLWDYQDFTACNKISRLGISDFSDVNQQDRFWFHLFSVNREIPFWFVMIVQMLIKDYWFFYSGLSKRKIRIVLSDNLRENQLG